MRHMQRVLRTPGAARFVGLAPATLEKLRLVGGGPRFFRLGARAVGYDIRDLKVWLDQCKNATDEQGEGKVADVNETSDHARRDAP